MKNRAGDLRELQKPASEMLLERSERAGRLDCSDQFCERGMSKRKSNKAETRVWPPAV